MDGRLKICFQIKKLKFRISFENADHPLSFSTVECRGHASCLEHERAERRTSCGCPCRNVSFGLKEEAVLTLVVLKNLWSGLGLVCVRQQAAATYLRHHVCPRPL